MKHSPTNSIFSLLGQYKWLILGLIFLAVTSNGLGLFIPRILSTAIDTYTQGTFDLKRTLISFLSVIVVSFVLSYLQGLMQVIVSERVARNLRHTLADKISRQSYATIQAISTNKLLTNLTSDVDAVKQFVSQAVATIITSFFLLIGSSVMLLILNWKLALAVLAVVPIIAFFFYLTFSKIRVYFKRAQEVIDRLNRIINESIMGAPLVRVLNSQAVEFQKFMAANTTAKDIGMAILQLFAGLIPVISFAANGMILIILLMGGRMVLGGTMTVGELVAFNSYISILIFPIVMIGFMSNVIARATASYQRISDVLVTKEKEEKGTIKEAIKGKIVLDKVSVVYGTKNILKDISLTIVAGNKTAIIGPTGAGKSQLIYLLTGLIEPQSGELTIDGKKIDDYDQESLHQQVATVFQDSILFNLTLEENITFGKKIKDEEMMRAIKTAELSDFIDNQPKGLHTIVSERGTSLSGGQKQRIMLARALALDPKVLLLDDFTARVDRATEKNILENIEKNYPNLTLISVTQKITSVEDYDQIILLEEGEILAQGKHRQLLKSSPEYVQIYNSQRSTEQL